MAKQQVEWSDFNDLTEENINASVPQKAGIYLFWVKLVNGNWKCFYVGQADNLKTRLLQHLADSEKNECIKTNVQKHICGYEYCLVGTQASRDGIEKYLYETYSPECNKISPPNVNPIEVNLP